jgi:WD40 repeat protein
MAVVQASNTSSSSVQVFSHVGGIAGGGAGEGFTEGAQRREGAGGAGMARAHDGDANAVSVSSNGHFVVSGGDDGRIKLWF